MFVGALQHVRQDKPCMSYMQCVVPFAFLYGNPLTGRTLFSGGSHTETAAAVQYPFWVACHLKGGALAPTLVQPGYKPPLRKIHHSVPMAVTPGKNDHLYNVRPDLNMP